MKKLLIGMIAVTLVLVTNAASFAWTVDNTYQPGTSDYAEGWAVVFFDNADMARGKFIASLADGSYGNNVNTYGGLASDLTDEDGYADGAAKRSDYGNPESIEGYFVLFDSADVADATNAYVSELFTGKTGAAPGQTGAINFGDVTATQVADNWTAVGAPEPTSGLLLLLGMAGLALKRKRA